MKINIDGIEIETEREGKWDFTKDELRHIGDALLYGMATLPERKEALMFIRGKVLNMIEEY